MTDTDRAGIMAALAANWPTENGGLYGKGGAWYGWGAIADAVLPLLTAERERADDWQRVADEHHKTLMRVQDALGPIDGDKWDVVGRATEARERADRLARVVEALCDRADSTTGMNGLLLTDEVRAALSAAETGSTE